MPALIAGADRIDTIRAWILRVGGRLEVLA